MKKLFTMILSVALLATMVVGGTLAQGSAIEFAKTPGNTVTVELVQEQRAYDENKNLIGLEPFKDNKEIVPLVGSAQYNGSNFDKFGMPTAEGYVDQIVRVKNTGTADAYVRIIVAVPALLEEKNALHWNLGNRFMPDGDFTDSNHTNNAFGDIDFDIDFKPLKSTYINGVKSNLYTFTYKNKLSPNETTAAAAFVGFYLDKDVNVINDRVVLNGVDTGFTDDTIDILVMAQAVQYTGMGPDATTAFEKANLPDNPWGEPLTKGQYLGSLTVTNDSGISEKIADKVTNVVFDYLPKAEYADFSKYQSQLLDNGSTAYYIPNGDGTYTLYILDDNEIHLKGECAKMFSGMSNLTNIDTSNLDTSNVTSMKEMFYGCKSLQTLDVSNWNTSNVTDMAQMFHSCNSLKKLNTSNWDVHAKSFNYMFHNCYELESVDVDGWVTSETTTMVHMFNNCYALQSINTSNWDTSNVTKMHDAFNGCRSITSLDVSSWDVSKVELMKQTFANCPSLVTIYAKSGTNWAENWGNKTVNTDKLFFHNTNLQGGNGTVYHVNQVDAKYARIDGGTSAPGYFTLKPTTNTDNSNS